MTKIIIKHGDFHYNNHDAHHNDVGGFVMTLYYMNLMKIMIYQMLYPIFRMMMQKMMLLLMIMVVVMMLMVVVFTMVAMLYCGGKEGPNNHG